MFPSYTGRTKGQNSVQSGLNWENYKISPLTYLSLGYLVYHFNNAEIKSIFKFFSF